MATALVAMGPIPGVAAESAEVQAIRAEIEALRAGFEARIHELEQRLAEATRVPVAADAPAATAPQPSSPASASTFNPAISLIAAGQFSSLQRDPSNWRIGGFIPGGDETGPGDRGFNLGESELTLSANVDPYFSGYFVMSVSSANSIAVEEGYIRNAGSIPGLTLKFGRMLSAFGYQNEIHAHAWDFVDAPLLHQAFFGGRLQEDGLQARWLAPTPIFFELGVEAGRGGAFPGSERSANGVNSAMAFAHVGGDAGISSSFRVGASYRTTRAQDRLFEDVDATGAPVINAFSGDSRMWGADFVWKWAPNGNAVGRNLKLQAEYMRRSEDGMLSFDATGRNLAGNYRSAQSGWYLQGAYQFMPRWRAGVRHEQLRSGSPDIGLVSSRLLPAGSFPLLAANSPRRSALMVDFSPSEFSRLRVQFARDEVRFHEADDQFILQYLMSLGAHGAHKF